MDVMAKDVVYKSVLRSLLVNVNADVIGHLGQFCLVIARGVYLISGKKNDNSTFNNNNRVHFVHVFVQPSVTADNISSLKVLSFTIHRSSSLLCNSCILAMARSRWVSMLSWRC